MQRRKPIIKQNGAVFVALLRDCAKHKDLYRGIKLHDDILERGLLGHCSDALVTMYAKCGALDRAKGLLDMHKSKDVYSWTALITGYVHNRQGEHALNCFEQMQREGLSPDAVTFASALTACGGIRALEKGELIHDEIARRGMLGNDTVLGNAVVDMYAKCGTLDKARQVLEELPVRDVVTWNALIGGYAQEGQGDQALACFKEMQREGIFPNEVTYSCILKACGSIGALDKGEEINEEISQKGLIGSNVVLGTALMDMYIKCGTLTKAQQVLEQLPIRDVVSWSALIAGYVQQGQNEQALDGFDRMQQEGLFPNAVTLSCILKACGSLKEADKGRKVHDEIIRRGLVGDNIVLANALVDMYAKCGALEKGRQVLEDLPIRNVISWNTLITGYAQEGKGEQALACFEEMQSEGLVPNSVTFLCILKACGSIRAVDKGEKLHEEMARLGLLKIDIVLDTALVDMYAKCGALRKAQQVLEELPDSDVVSWSALISGYAQQGQGEQALLCFERMQRKGLCPNAITFLSILNACGSMGAADKGKQIHDEIARQGLLGDEIALSNAVVDMYAKCGALLKARRVLEDLPVRNAVSWNSLIAGYAQNGEGEQAMTCFECMLSDGLSPNEVTFLCMLNACSHLGLLDDAETYFENMSSRFGMRPDLGHYTCMVDLFARTGHLDKAIRVVDKLASSDFSSECARAVWSSLLGACSKWGDVNVGRWAFKRALQVDGSDGAAYVLMSHVYAAAGMRKHTKIPKR